MRDAFVSCGLGHLSLHGLRKAFTTRLVHAGALPHEIMSLTGHKSLAEVQRYSEKVRKNDLAHSGMDKLTAYLSQAA